MDKNRALEALAVAPDGTVVTVPEHSANDSTPFPVYQFDGHSWTKGPFLPRDGDFLPTGADFGPDGLFYLLERRLSFRGLPAVSGGSTCRPPIWPKPRC